MIDSWRSRGDNFKRITNGKYYTFLKSFKVVETIQRFLLSRKLMVQRYIVCCVKFEQLMYLFVKIGTKE